MEWLSAPKSQTKSFLSNPNSFFSVIFHNATLRITPFICKSITIKHTNCLTKEKSLQCEQICECWMRQRIKEKKPTVFHPVSIMTRTGLAAMKKQDCSHLFLNFIPSTNFPLVQSTNLQSGVVGLVPTDWYSTIRKIITAERDNWKCSPVSKDCKKKTPKRANSRKRPFLRCSQPLNRV